MTKRRIPNTRNLRIAHQIHRDLSELIRQEIKDHHINQITIQEVVLSADFSVAKVYFTTLSDPKKTELSLNKASGYLHNLLYKCLHIHTIPTLRFIYDNSFDYALTMNNLIEQANHKIANIEEAIPVE